MMELKDLRIFKSVAELGSISKAAQKLSFVQSYITTRVKVLETELETELLLRHSRGTTLTADGEKLLEYADEILNRVDDLQAAFKKDSPAGNIDIGAVETITKLPEILTDYQIRYPNANLSVYTDVTKNVVAQIINRDIDCAFVADFNHHPKINKIELLRETLVLISKEPEITAETLKQKPMLVFKAGCSYRADLEKWLNDEGIERNRLKEFGTLETIIGSVKSGFGISLVPRSGVSELIASGALHSHEIPEQYSRISTDFIWHKHTTPSYIMERFIETIRDFKIV